MDNRAFHLSIKGSGGLDLLNIQGFGIEGHIAELQIRRIEYDGRRFFFDIKAILQINAGWEWHGMTEHTLSSRVRRK